MSSAKRPPSCLGLNESMSQWVNKAKNELMKPRLYLLWIHLCTFFPMFAIHMCEKICFFFLKYLSGTMFCVCTCTNQLVLSTEVTRLNFLNSIVMGQINQCGFQSHVAIDRYCIFLEINTFELSWVELSSVLTGILILIPYLVFMVKISLCFCLIKKIVNGLYTVPPNPKGIRWSWDNFMSTMGISVSLV